MGLELSQLGLRPRDGLGGYMGVPRWASTVGHVRHGGGGGGGGGDVAHRGT